jgi:hypothetical protein
MADNQLIFHRFSSRKNCLVIHHSSRWMAHLAADTVFRFGLGPDH